MFTHNPFTELSAFIPPMVMQIYVIAMAVLVVGGTLIDTMHKKSAKWFFENAEEAKKSATKTVSTGDAVAIAGQTLANEILLSAEFCNQKRRLSHLLTMYGFLLFIISTAIMVFFYPTDGAATPTYLPVLWHVGALMLAIGGYWFWFFIRVDVAAEGVKFYHLVRADLFILSLLATATFALIWSYLQWTGGTPIWETVFLALFILSSTVLFGGVLWSKFAHMFFKPAAAFQKRMTKADGSAENLPTIGRDDPEQRKRHSMELLQDAPMDMGLGIKREQPRHY